MEILRYKCFYCENEFIKPIEVTIGDYFDIPRLFCSKCLIELDWELIDEDTGATKLISDDSGDR